MTYLYTKRKQSIYILCPLQNHTHPKNKIKLQKNNKENRNFSPIRKNYTNMWKAKPSRQKIFTRLDGFIFKKIDVKYIPLIMMNKKKNTKKIYFVKNDV